jgi:hypothetical protein
LARIEVQSGNTDVPLCETCVASDGTTDAIVRKFWNAPDLKIEEGSEATTKQIQALIDKQDKPQH